MIEILAVRPPGTSTVIHLEIPGYQPSSKPRNPGDSVLCNAFVSRGRSHVPLADALGWTKPPANDEPHEQWRWCRHCLGHAITAVGLADAAIGVIVDAARGAETA